MAKVTTKDHGNVAGIWVESDKGQVGIIASDDFGPAIVFYGHGDSFPALAIGINPETHRTEVQLPGPDGKVWGAHFVSFDQLFDAVKTVAADESIRAQDVIRDVDGNVVAPA